jgi:hypothetical protein
MVMNGGGLNVLSILADTKVRGKTLAANECSALLEFLREAKIRGPYQRMAAVKNEVMVILHGQPNLPDPWDRLLATLYADAAQPVEIRDYALQHLFTWYEEIHYTPPNSVRSEQLVRMEKVFCQGTQEIDSEIAGTALLGLHRLSQQAMVADRTRIITSSLAVAGDSGANAMSRSTALQICAPAGASGVLPTARKLAQETDSIALRCAAIAALGELGGVPELELLRGLPSKPDCDAAVRAATRKLTFKLRG